jgi:hypothetical protein
MMDPSPTPKFDNPKMNRCAALQLFGAGREKRIYAIPPYTGWFRSVRGPSVRALSLPRRLRALRLRRKLPGRGRDRRPRWAMFLCSDTDYCESRRESAATSLCRLSRSRGMLDQTELVMRPAVAADSAAGSRSLCAARFRCRQRPASRDRPPTLDRFDDYPDYTLYVAERAGHRRQLRLA